MSIGCGHQTVSNHIKGSTKGCIAQPQNLISIDPGVWPEKLQMSSVYTACIGNCYIKDSPTTSPAYDLPTANKFNYQQTPTRRLPARPVTQNKARFPVPTLDTQFSPILFTPHPQKPQHTAVNQQHRSTAKHCPYIATYLLPFTGFAPGQKTARN